MAINPDTVSEPAWKMALNIIMRTEQGVAAAHEFSSGYAGYNHAETEEKAAAADEFGKPLGIQIPKYGMSKCAVLHNIQS